MEIIIIEDEKFAADNLKKLLTNINPAIQIIEIINSVEDAVNWFKNNPEPDLIFMDIQLSDGISFEIFNKVNIKSPVIFATAFDDYTIQAFKSNGIDYLLKPVSVEELRKAITKFENLRQSFTKPTENNLVNMLNQFNINEKSIRTRFLIKSGSSFITIIISDIAYFYAEEQVTFIHTLSGKRHICDYTLDSIEKMINSDVFFRINRQFIININCISGIHPYFNSRLKLNIKPEIDKEIIVSRDKTKAFKLWLGD